MQPPEAAVNREGASPPPNSARWLHWLTLILLLGAATVVRFFNLASKPFWFDECFSVEVAQIGWCNFVRLLWWREANMSLYYLLLRIWLGSGQLFGAHYLLSGLFIRSLSVITAAATLPAIYWLARLLYDRRVAWIAAALFAFNGYSVRYAQEARSYALFLLLATLSSGCLVAYLREPTRRHRIGYVVVSILAVYAHFYALLLPATHWLAVRWFGGASAKTEKPRAFARLRQSWTIIGLAVLPLLIFVAKTGAGPIRWIQRPGLRDVLTFYQHLAGSDNWLLPLLLVVACVAAVAGHGKRLLASDQNWETWRSQFLLLWLFFPVGLTVVLSFARPVFLGRYMIFCLPALVILAAAGLVRLRKSWLLAPALAAILILSAQGIFFVYGHDFDNERDASGVAANFILDHTQPGDAVVFHIAETRIPYEFFRSVRAGENTASSRFTKQLGPEIVFPHDGPGLDYRDFTGKPTAEMLRSSASGHPRMWIMLMNNGSAGKPGPTTVMLTTILSQSFPRMLNWQFAKVEVRLYSKE